MPRDSYEPQAYWTKRLVSHPDLSGTGHRRFSVDYNDAMYQIATENLQAALGAAQVDLKGAQVLDIGPGLGYFVGRYVEWGARHITGVDITQVSVQSLQRQFPAHDFYQADIGDETFQVNAQFDYVSAISVVYHIVDELHFQRALANMCQSVRPGGYLLISDAFRRAWQLTAAHARWRSLDHYTPILAEHNLAVVAVRPMYFFMSRTYIPGLGPLVLNLPVVVRLLLRAERRMRHTAPPQSGYLRYMIAHRAT